MGISNWFKIVKNKKIHKAIFEIAVNTHSPFCPKLVDYSACVPPALQNGFVNSFDFDNFESHKHSYTQFWSQTLLYFFSLWVTLANLGVYGKQFRYSIRFSINLGLLDLVQLYSCFGAWQFTKSVNFKSWPLNPNLGKGASLNDVRSFSMILDPLPLVRLL